jgi:hypothetical protein
MLAASFAISKAMSSMQGHHTTGGLAKDISIISDVAVSVRDAATVEWVGMNSGFLFLTGIFMAGHF